jgi:broad specificity phosphatase PhoE
MNGIYLPIHLERRFFVNRLYLVRHAENHANITKEFSYKKIDYSLTAKGILQAQQTAAYFKGKQIHAIYSSPLKRARETAEIIAAPLELDVIVSENFREINVGELEGKTSREDWARYGDITDRWFNGEVELSFPGGENYVQLWARIRAGIEAGLSGRTNETIILIGHGGFFLNILPDLCHNITADQLRNGDNGNCSITDILIDTIPGELVQLASLKHLSGEAANLIPGILR